jgi:hypothetical protein
MHKGAQNVCFISLSSKIHRTPYGLESGEVIVIHERQHLLLNEVWLVSVEPWAGSNPAMSSNRPNTIESSRAG